MELNEFKLNQDPEYLANFEMELEDLKDILDTWGPDSLYAVPYSRFKRDYPLFAKAIVESFLVDMGILTQNEISDIDNLGDEDGNYWKTGRLIRPEEDWPTLIDGAERLLTFRKDKGIQWEKIYPKHVGVDKPNNSINEDMETLDDEVYPIIKEYFDWFLDPNENEWLADQAAEKGVDFFDEARSYLFEEDPEEVWRDPEVGIIDTGLLENEELADIWNSIPDEDLDEFYNKLITMSKDYAKQVLDSK